MNPAGVLTETPRALFRIKELRFRSHHVPFNTQDHYSIPQPMRFTIMKITLTATLVSFATLACSCVADDYGSTPPQAESSGHVVVNGRELNQADIEGFIQVYGAAPVPGRYWYDASSGLFGSEGQPPAGFMYAGHDLGALNEGASAGQQSLWLNGRQMTGQEVLYLGQLLNIAPQPGRYWFDSTGNLGVEGSPYALVNLFAVARSAASQGGSGDNIWSSLYGGGNSNADNTQGYVSVPGHGPVSYGF